MRRRQVLTAAALSIASLAGCTGPGTPDETPTGDSTETDTSSTETDTVTPDPDDPILLVVSNGRDVEQTVSVTLTRGETTLLDESPTVEPGGRAEFDTGIADPGEYELAVDVEGDENRTFPVTIEAFDVRHGSNHILELMADRMVLLVEE
ncbi:hypothetical protein NDI85_05740 [Halomicroarcula sp. S1AR25-4]|uniref:hypothetical protein n=1 Tax=Haloarcula sp. S1AR25-4 TaxID=2950538 RepID=UPI00287635F3|nr:hypothetical protein [Halomicroarcula sp. S1AR25-4]MDS0277286.1 hypothetical protein [Halomicroarcula sp. S1AR25-4]